MPTIASPLSTSQSYIPAVNATEVGKFAGLQMHFPTFAAFAAAVTTEKANVAATSPIWADQQPMTVASEPIGVIRTWSVALNHARTAQIRSGLMVVLAADSNTVLQVSGAPSAGTGANGDISVDWSGNTVYLKSAGAWAVSVASIFAAGVAGAAPAPVELPTATALTSSVHGNRDLIGTSATTRAHTIAATGFTPGDEIRGYNDAAGTMTFTGAGFTITGSALLPVDVAQHEPFVFKCRANGVWKRLA